jgi:D-alanyl-lipoteichoic acid acyltransferase DltB (MBOAT superfamily)
MASGPFVVGILLYALVGRLLLTMPGRARMLAFAALNIGMAAGLFYRKSHWPWMIAVYVAVVCVHWLLVRRFATPQGRGSWIAFWMPLVVLVLVKCNFIWAPLWAGLGTPPALRNSGLFFVGISYMAFRLSYLALEVRNRAVDMPRLEEHLAFAFFVPTMSLGPISNYQTFITSVNARERLAVGTSLLRTVVGFAKYLFIGELFNTIGYDGLLHDGQAHGRLDYLVAALCYYLYLYCNFSGFCDVAIGLAGLMNIRIQENFDRPFIARNPKEYWNRWHITLSHWMRDVVFAPLSKLLTRWFGPRHVKHALAVSVFVVFLLVGIWHGIGWGYFVFGLIHAVGVTANHYYTLALKSALGAQRFRRYMANRVVHALAVAATFAYVTIALASFAVPFWPDVYHHIFW